MATAWATQRRASRGVVSRTDSFDSAATGAALRPPPRGSGHGAVGRGLGRSPYDLSVRVAVVVLLALVLTGCTEGVSGTAVPTPASMEATSPARPPLPRPEPTQEGTSMPTDTTPSAPFALTSPAFSDGAAMPGRYSCDGRDVSPPLTWSGVPLGTKALLLSVTDLDARGFVHWVAWDLVPGLGGLAEGASGALPDGAVEGRNDFGRIGWGGPCPPSGTHRYAFTLTALPAPLRLPRSTGLAAVQRGAAGATLGETSLVGTYRR